jgi:hypothetical protein
MTMDCILTLIGQGVNSESVQSIIVTDSLVPSAEDDLEEGVPPMHYLSSYKGGYVLTHVRGRISAAHLFLTPANDYRPFDGALLSGLSRRSTRGEVQHRLGKPSRSAEARTVRILGRQGPWDRYDGEHVCIHFQYAEHDDRIQLITVMAADSAP